ncbi:MAG: hypothetical protein ACK6CT_05290 [Planctomycetia bacterium]|jgi:hypothetical protein
MQNFLARCAVIAIIGGGFAATGDVSHVVSRGLRLIEAADVPLPSAAEAAEPTAETTATPAPPSAAHEARPVPLRPAPRGPESAAPHRPEAATPASFDPHPSDDGGEPVDHRPPANGPERIDVSALRAGDRITIWLRTAAVGTPERLFCDLIDPPAGEVLVHGGAGPSARGLILSTTGRPTVLLVRGGTIRMQRIGAGAALPTDLLASGTIVALAHGH